MTIPHHVKRVSRYALFRSFIITSVSIKPLITKRLPKCIFTRHEHRPKKHRGVEKEESSSYLSQFLCLDKVGHHSHSLSGARLTFRGSRPSRRK